MIGIVVTRPFPRSFLLSNHPSVDSFHLIVPADFFALSLYLEVVK
jgi:hypothetical protein